jgi:signal peptidase I
MTKVALLVLLALILRIFVVDLYQVSSTSMCNSYRIGDIVLVDKLTLGPKVPLSPAEIPFLKGIIHILRIKNNQSRLLMRYFNNLKRENRNLHLALVRLCEMHRRK